MRTMPTRALSLTLLAAVAGCSVSIDPNSVKPPGPTIALSTSTLTFSAMEGGTSPAAQAFTVSNSGGGVLGTPVATVAYATGGAWCTVSVSGAAAPYTVSVQPAVGGLAAGTYRATVSVAVTNATNSPRSVAVTFTVGSSTQPTIALSSSALTFSATEGGANPATQDVSVSNAGAGTLAQPTTSISYGAGAGWLSATVSGAAAPFTITVQPTTGTLAAGTYTATVSVASAGASNTPQTFSVTFNVASPPQPTIALSTTGLTFSATEAGASPAGQTVSVTNAGTGTLATPTTSISYGSGAGWLSATVSGAAAPFTITVQPTTGTLAAGTYTATVSVMSAGATNTPQSFSVTFNVAPPPQPNIALSTTGLTFAATQGGANPTAQTVSVTNSGAGTLAAPTTSISYGSGAGWLSATVSGATVPFTVTVQPTTGALAPGSYAATVSVASTGASNTPQTFTVTFNVGSAAQPTIALSAAGLAFTATQGGADPAAQTVSVTNSGAGTLATPTASISYGSGAGWLSATVSGAAVPFTVTVQPTTGALTPGTYTATVSVASTGASNTPQTFTVTFDVGSATLPTIALSTPSLTFAATQGGASPVAQTVSVSNSGTGTLAAPTTSIAYGSGAGWLTATVSGGSAPFTVTVQPTTGALVTGTYTATVSVASPGASNTPQAFTVTFFVGSATLPTIALSTSSLTFAATQGRGDPGPQTVSVSNSGVGVLAAPTTSIAYGSGAGWLSAAVTGAGAPFTITVQPTTGALTAGTYTATVSVASAGASNTPQTFSVTFNVVGPLVSCIASGTATLCTGYGWGAGAGGFSSGAAPLISSPANAVNRAALTAGGSPPIQSTSATIRASALVPGTATP